MEILPAKSGLSFIVPAYNEEKSIADTLRRLINILSVLDIPTEIIVVNDGSTDNTKSQAMLVRGISIINHPNNIGYGNAIKTGFNAAKYEWVGIVDGDGSYPIEDIPVLLEAMREGYDMVVAKRENTKEFDSILKRISRTLFIKFVKILNDSHIEDPNSGFRILKRDLAIRLLPFLCGTFSFTTSLSILMSGMYYFIRYVPIHYKKRVGHSKVRHFRDSVRTCLYVMQGIFFFNPIKFFILLSLAIFIFILLPSAVLSLLKFHTLSLYYLVTALTVTLLIGMGALGDIIRISHERNR